MIIVLNCPGCQKRYELDGALAGKKSRCKQCGAVFQIPLPTGRVIEPGRPASATGSRPVPAAAAPPAQPSWMASPVAELMDGDPVDRPARPAALPPRPAPSKPAASSFDDDLPPPPRSIHRPARRASREREREEDDTDLGVTVAGWYLLLSIVSFVGSMLYVMTNKPGREIAVSMGVIWVMAVSYSGLALCAWAYIWTLIVAFRRDTGQGIFCALVPGYAIIFVFMSWRERKGLLALSAAPAVVLMGMSMVIALREQASTAQAPQGGRPVAEAPPRLADNGLTPMPNMPAPTIPQHVNSGPPPVVGPPDMPGGPRMIGGPPNVPGGLPQGPRLIPGGMAREAFGSMSSNINEQMERDYQRVRAQHGDRTVGILVTGLPTGGDPTTLEVGEAISRRVKELAPETKVSRAATIGYGYETVIAPVNDIQALAIHIDFGTVKVKEWRIEVQLDSRWAAKVPRKAAQPKPERRPGAGSRPDDPDIPAGADAVTRSLIELKSPDMGKRKRALERLQRTEPDGRVDQAVGVLLPMLEDDDGFFVSDVVKTLAVWRSPEAMTGLIGRMRDNRHFVRSEAIKALGKYRDVHAAEAVVTVMKDDGFAAEDALKEMGEVAEPAVIPLLRSPDSGLRRQACQILAQIGGQATLREMQSLRPDADLGVRMAANDARNRIVARVGSLPRAPRTKGAR